MLLPTFEQQQQLPPPPPPPPQPMAEGAQETMLLKVTQLGSCTLVMVATAAMATATTATTSPTAAACMMECL
jgi:hypothetical protein